MQTQPSHNVHKCTDCFKYLGVPSRMSIYTFLEHEGPKSVSDVVTHVNLTQPTVSYHLAEMKKAGLIEFNRRGKEVFYNVTKRCINFDTECVLKDVKFTDDRK